MDKEITLAKDWLLRSGIQNAEGPRAGGVNSWFDMAEGGYSYVYSEITGYGITTLLYLGDRFGDGQCLERAGAAAEWLMSNAAHPCGGVRTRDYYNETEESDLYSFDSGNIYAFDNGMVLYGMVNLYRRTQDRRHLDFALRIADFLIKKMARSDGLFFAVFDAGTGNPEDVSRKWSSQRGSYHGKLALGFIDLFDVTGDETYESAALALCRGCMDFQEDSGRFITSRADKSTHLHPHCYSAEGLLYAGMRFDNDEFIDSAALALKWALDNRRSDGGIPKKFDGERFIPYYRSDVLAQVLRLGVILCGIGKLGVEYIPELERLRNRLLGFQYTEKGPQAGGFFYGTTLNGSSKKHLNSWCTMFAVQALCMYADICEDNGTIDKMECFV